MNVRKNNTRKGKARPGEVYNKLAEITQCKQPELRR